MSARTAVVASKSIPLETLDEPQRNTSAESSPTLTASFDAPDTHLHPRQQNDDNGHNSNNDGENIDAPKQADESVDTSVFPPLPFHYSFVTTQLYRVLSFFLSLAFLTLVIILALLKTLPSIGWVIWSWCQFKDPNCYRPFYQQEKQRKKKNPGKLKCDVAYYAEQQGLSCDEFKVETEDGFVLIIQHILDRQPGSIDSKRAFPACSSDERKISSVIAARINAIIWHVLCQ